jgi:hypothetical protein
MAATQLPSPAMSHYQAPPAPIGEEADAANALLRLRNVLALVERMTGEPASGWSRLGAAEASLDEGAMLAAAYAHAPTIARRRFDALASETAGFAAAGLHALIRHKERTGHDSAPAARQLAGDMRQSIDAMTSLILGRV